MIQEHDQNAKDYTKMSDSEKIKYLEKRNQYLEAENDYLKKLEAVVQKRISQPKKIRSCSSKKNKSTTEEKSKVIFELQQKHKLCNLLKISGLSKYSYFYSINKADKDLKNSKVIAKIKQIFTEHKSRYGYRRITLELNNQ